MHIKPKVKFQNLGRIKYSEAWDYQKTIQQKIIDHKRSKANPDQINQENYLLICEHNPVYTLGKSGSIEHLLLSDQSLKENSIEFFKINRGGDITYHGPGQITGYPIFDLDEFFTDVHKYVRYLEEVVIQTLDTFGIKGGRFQGYTGVWIDEENSSLKRKICAIGVHLSRWVTMHGFALNVNTDLDYFSHIIPCGIKMENTSVTSMQKELGIRLDRDEVVRVLKSNFAKQFDFDYL